MSLPEAPPGLEPIVMPKWGLAMQEGTLAKWHVEEGARLEKGQEIMDIETSKIANVFESPVAGTLKRRIVDEGETVPVGALLGVCIEGEVDDAAIDAFVRDFQENFTVEDADAGGPEPETIEVGGKRLRYLKMGDAEGPPVLFIHGFGGDLLGWMFNQEPIAEHHTTYALDLPGHGGSSKDVGDGSLMTLASAVIAFMDAQGLERAHLVGHSMGGAAALLLALEHPERVASATLIAPAALGEEIDMAYIDGFIAEKRAKKLRPVLERLVAKPESVTSEMVDEVIKYKRLDGVDQALRTIRNQLMPGGKQAGSLRHRLDELRVPTQVLWGEEDRILPVAHSDGLPETVQVARYEDAGHLPQMERASAVNEAILRLTG